MNHKNVRLAVLAVLALVFVVLAGITHNTKKGIMELETAVNTMSEEVGLLEQKMSFFVFWQKEEWADAIKSPPEPWGTLSAKEQQHYIVLGLELIRNRFELFHNSTEATLARLPKRGIGISVDMSESAESGVLIAVILISQIFLVLSGIALYLINR